ncbi:MAG: 3-hydroxyacyl-CoA dehydrogenase/enoyl-CoA hydratase family protein, partial [Proteobacteria bacterium]|nr:3-hydroxyacyl-CoA dehydrogenase/enoyl-CoA hydratase family protein [Pseudomonadota bacterium]
NMSCVSRCDWIIEAVVENLAIKKDIHAKIQTFKKSANVPVTTNTSGILLKNIAQDFNDEYCQSFMGVHFFNPPRYMQLLEMIPHPKTNLTLLTQLSDWCEQRLGKTVVQASDTINFIANRIGVFSLCSVAHHATELGLNPETVDSLTGKLMGRPASATYRTMDVVGLDTSNYVAENVLKQVEDDPYREMFNLPPWIKNLIEKGMLGQKSNFRGIYEKTKDDRGKTRIRSYDYVSESYTDQEVTGFPWLKEVSTIKNPFDRLNFLVNQSDKGAQLIWHTLCDLFSYSALLLDEIAHSEPYKLDQAMKLGFNWELGVFETWQGMGFHAVTQKMIDQGVQLPEWLKSKVNDPSFCFFHPAPSSDEWLLSDLDNEGKTKKMQWHPKSQTMKEVVTPPYYVPLLKKYQPEKDPRTVKGNDGASLLDLGHGAYLLNFHTKMNAINVPILSMIDSTMSLAKAQAKAVVIANQGRAFSAGADLKMILGLINEEKFLDLEAILNRFQESMQLLKFSHLPVVAAPHGLTLGGGCEVTLHADHCHLAGETYAGLVEAGVGLIPAAGGSKELALRCYRLAAEYDTDPMIFLDKVFKMVAMAKVSSSAYDAIHMGLYDKACTSVTFSRSHQISEAKSIALMKYRMGYQPPSYANKIKVVGEPGFETFRMMLYNMEQGKMISSHDALVAEKLAFVLSGGDLPRGTEVDEMWFLDLERQAFVDLCREEKTKERIEYMLKNGKPLRN